MRERLRGSDYRFLAICLALLGATVWFSARNFYKAFPEASIDFKVNRDGARTLAGNFLSTQRYGVAEYRNASQFDYDDDAKTFLERVAGLEQANRLMGTRVRLWRWKNRWFRPLQKEEFQVEVTPRGELVGFEHQLPEDAARPDVTSGQARALAEDFLRTRMHRDPAALDFVEEADVARPHRVDRTFTWKERDFELHDATYRIAVTTLGNEVGEYSEYLKVPEQWKRDYQRLRSKNEVTQAVDSAGMVLLMVALIVVIIVRVMRHDVRWRTAALVGMAGMALGFLAQLNEFPLHEYGYPTTDSYSSFVLRQVLNALLSALGTGGFLFVLAAGAEPVYREYLGSKISLSNLLTQSGLRTKRFFLGTVLGLTLTGIFIAYQTGFYIVAYRFGAWSPADVPYSDLLNTKFPWAFVLFGGFFPAVFEEFAFRMFAIPFLRKVARSVAMAVVLAGFLWGFGHSSYPQQPFYIRGMEVGVGGVALGIIMLRFGILPTLVWHYSVDAMYSALLLVRSESLYYKLSGVAAAGIMVLPALIALGAYLRKGGFEPEEGLRNKDEESGVRSQESGETQAPAEAETPSLPYQPLSVRMRWVAVGLLAGGIACLAIPVSRFGEKPRYTIGAERAVAAASGFLSAHGFDPGAFSKVTIPAVHWDANDRMAAKYFVERLPLGRASEMFASSRPVHHWMTRYFKPLDEEEVYVSVHPETAQALGFAHTIPEDRPGADLPVEQARALAAQFASAHGWDVSGMDLKESSSEKKKARRDSSFEWEARAGDPRNVGETKFRVAVGVSGDRVTSARVFWKTPEAFDRSREGANAISIAVAVARIAAISGLLVYALWLLIQGTRRGVVPWRAAIQVAAVGAVLLPVEPLLSLGLIYRDYNTAKPIETFQVEAFLQGAIGIVGGCLGLAIAAALIVMLYPRAVESLKRVNRRVLGVDAAFAAMAGAGIALLYRQGHAALISRFHAQALLSASAPDLLATTAPALGAVAGAVHSTITLAAVLGLVAFVLARVKSRWKLAAGGLLAVCALVPGDVHTAGELALEYGWALFGAAAIWAFFRNVVRDNYLACALVVWLAALWSPLALLLGNGNASLDLQAAILAAAMVASVAWVVRPAFLPETADRKS